MVGKYPHANKRNETPRHRRNSRWTHEKLHAHARQRGTQIKAKIHMRASSNMHKRGRWKGKEAGWTDGSEKKRKKGYEV
eukprot:6192256-Pleurochrysis_carterae.AAC.3